MTEAAGFDAAGPRARGTAPFAEPGGVGRAVDWELATTVGARLARPAPPVTDYTRDQVIEELATASRAAEPPVRDVTGLHTDGPIPEAAIVDRPEWISAAAASMRAMLGATEAPVPRLAARLTGGLAGAQTGAVLAFVSTGILGQYDPFTADGGKLLLVYPNVIAVERQLRVSPSDFRLWVCLHEVTHRVQFTANAWLADYMSQALGVLTSDAGEDFAAVAGRLAAVVRQHRSGEPDPAGGGILGVVRAMQSEPQREALDRLLMLGTLLEGHAEHVMDAVGPAVVPSVATIRARFNQRRTRRQPALQRILRAVLGIDAKLAQYTRGKAFVDDVVGRVGMERFNTVWTGPATVPLPDEIDHPQRWIDRVL